MEKQAEYLFLLHAPMRLSVPNPQNYIIRKVTGHLVMIFVHHNRKVRKALTSDLIFVIEMEAGIRRHYTDVAPRLTGTLLSQSLHCYEEGLALLYQQRNSGNK